MNDIKSADALVFRCRVCHAEFEEVPAFKDDSTFGVLCPICDECNVEVKPK